MAQLAALVAVTKQVPEWHHLDTGGTAVGKTHAAPGWGGREGGSSRSQPWRVSREPAIIFPALVPRGCRVAGSSGPTHVGPEKRH